MDDGIGLRNVEVLPVLSDDDWTSDESGESLENGLSTRRSRKRRKLQGRESPTSEKNSNLRKICRRQMISRLNNFRKDGIMTDVVISIPGQPDIDAHKIVLAAASPFFQTMFQVHDFYELYN